MKSQNNFESFIKAFKVDSSTKHKGLVSVYLKNYYLQFISSMIQQGFTEKMVYCSLVIKDPTLKEYLNYHSLRSWIRVNVKKGSLTVNSQTKALRNESINADNIIKKQQSNLHPTCYSNKFNYEIRSSLSLPPNNNGMKIPSPQEPIQQASKEVLKKLSNFELDGFYVDSKGILFDGYSSESDKNLVPVPSQFQFLAQQVGIKRHYFLYKNQTIDSNNLLNFLKSKIQNGTFAFTFIKI